MKFVAALQPVFNRGPEGDKDRDRVSLFLGEMVDWARSASEEIFAPNDRADIYGKVRAELGPWRGIVHRKAVMLEVMRVLAGFESSWDWTEGVDTSRLGDDSPENSEAGAWQVSYDARTLSPGPDGGELRALLRAKGIGNGVKFQQAMKFDHPLAMEFVARVLRWNTKHNGPLYKGEERNAIRKSLRGEQHSIYPWLRTDAVDEFEARLSA